MKLFGFPNLNFDVHSEYQFELMNETFFIQGIFQKLKDDWFEEFKDLEFYIYSSHKKHTTPASINRISTKKKILIYLSDETGELPENLAPHYFAIFKSYIGDQVPKAENIFPFPLGYVNGVPSFQVKPMVERKVNIFFRGNINANRIDLYKNLSSFGKLLPKSSILSGDRYRRILLKLQSDFSNRFPDSIIIFNSDFKSGYSLEEYGKMLSESKIVLCPKGFERAECFRHFEAMRAGCVIISEKLPNIEFYNNSPIIEIDNWKDGLKIANGLLNDPNQLDKIQQQMIDWWMNKCSEDATAKYIIDKVKELSFQRGSKVS
ncbi:hypothetical protein [Pleomorphovibrio marinus]|uniref:hypothetical protein n=1 Tax=Pleomorphovibrio marinus TaxID=2164132 RepID=UPI000E0B5203|nr:hypothetical protein [Pleomorphovibrio marinus]